jgi:hypothetical protein
MTKWVRGPGSCPQNLGWLISSRFMLLLHSIPGRLPYGCLLFLYRLDLT